MANGNGEFSLFQIIIVVLSVYVLGALAVSTFVNLSPETALLLDYIDFGICIIFLFEFIYNFTKAENKWRYMRWGWIDLISSIPALPYVRIGRMARLVRILRILRAFRSMKAIMQFVSNIFVKKYCLLTTTSVHSAA